ncbi:MAG: hypothetical protein WD379_10765 [Dehalococcoidia bacterium]
MPAKVIVMVADKEDEKRGEITVLEDPRKAELLIETLLEAGFEQERIRLYTGDKTDIQVAYRPVVALVNDDGGQGRVRVDTLAQELGREPEPDADQELEPVMVSARREPARAEQDATPFVKDGVRFSSLFQTTHLTRSVPS